VDYLETAVQKIKIFALSRKVTGDGKFSSMSKEKAEVIPHFCFSEPTDLRQCLPGTLYHVE